MHYSLLVIHDEGENIDDILEPFYEEGRYDWYQDGVERNWTQLLKKDGTFTYSCKFSELELPQDYESFAVVFDKKWYWRFKDEKDKKNEDDYKMTNEEFETLFKKEILPKIKPEHVLTIIDFHF